MILITKKEKPELFEALRYVTKAIDDKNSRFALRHLLVTPDGQIVATDGHRLHKWAPTVCPFLPGQYTVLKRTKSELILCLSNGGDQYPQWQRIIPTRDNFVALKMSCCHGRYAEVIRMLKTSTINFEYFREALEEMPGKDDATVSVDDDLSPIVFKSGEFLAVVMPLRERVREIRP